MKKNHIIIRPMGNFKVEQRSKDCFFNATSLLKQWNEKSNTKKDMDDYIGNKETIWFIDYLATNGITQPFLSYRGRSDRGGGTWMCEHMFVHFISWLSCCMLVHVSLSFDEPTFFSKIQDMRCIQKHTYLMYDENTSLTKIGHSKNPLIRERTLQSEKPTISLFAICEKDVEKKLHDAFSNNRVRGEWFRLSQAQLYEIINQYKFKIPQAKYGNK